MWIQHCPRWVLIPVEIRLEPVHIKPRWFKYEVEMRFLTIGMIGLIALALAACGGGGGTEIKVGQLVSGEITSSDTDDGEWKSQTYVIDVVEDISYSFELTSLGDDTVGIWNAEASGYIVETNLIVTNHTQTFIFPESGSQNSTSRA
tara:strand:+ start:460 stop:900 length:441 start_codon:yes stop_codon:yes gene_type:complete